jgi:hypothetical protein
MSEQIKEGHYLASFERELVVRRRTVDYWIERRNEKSDENCSNAAHDSLAAALDAGFFREYVYEAYNVGYWPAPDDLRLEAFAEWSNSTLPEHDPIRFPGAQVTWKEVDENDEP